MRKTWMSAAAAALLVGSLTAGCGMSKKPAASGPSGFTQPRTANGSETAATPAPSPSPSPAVQKHEWKIQAYYGDPTGTKLVAKTVTVKADDETGKYLAALNALKVSGDDSAVPLCKGFTFHSAKLQSGQLTVDLSFKAEDQLGSEGEALLIDAFKKTLFQFSEVQAVDILVDGKKAESLMGHMDLPHPLHRS